MNKNWILIGLGWLTMGAFAQKPVPPHVVDRQWNITLKAMTDSIVFTRVNGAEKYRLLLDDLTYNEALPPYKMDKHTNYFTVVLVPGVQFDRKYMITIEAFVNGNWQAGTSSYMYTPAFPHVRIHPSRCGEEHPIGRGLIFEPDFRERTVSEVNIYNVHRTLIDRMYLSKQNPAFFTPAWSDAINFGREYYITIRPKYNNEWREHAGSFCKIKIEDPPSTSILSKFCDNVLSSNRDQILAEQVPGAGGYDFKITKLPDGPTQVIPRTHQNFWFVHLNMLKGPVAHNTDYEIQVRIRRKDTASGQWTLGEWGDACVVTTPPK